METLTPIKLDDEQKEKINYSNYEKLLDEVMVSDNYCNIALTGGYGAGKSTILSTYEDEHKWNTIHISLAKLNDEETENVQAKLINQIIHQIEPKLIPQTQFKVKKIVSWTKVAVITILLFLFIASVIYLFKVPSAQIPNNSKISCYEIFWHYRINIVMLVTALGSFFILLGFIVNAQLKRPLIKSIHMDKSQIELVEKENEQTDEKEKFDKYMDEIIYLFEKSGVDILVIEDLDRLEDVKIFYELRQINYLVNRRLEKRKKKRKIRFIYMIRDELFKKSEERTKFFDIIIPVVPVIDNSNSYDLLKKMMGIKWLEKLDGAYLKMICMYIHDYRILKNIFNEFQVYYAQLRIEEYSYVPMKLFAMITYKNLWPADFAKLQQGKGNVYEALKSIEEVRKNRSEALEDEIKELQCEMATMQSEVIKNIDELDALYFEKELYPNNNVPGCYVIDGKSEHTFNSRVDFIRALKNSNNVTWHRQGYTSKVPISKDRIVKGFEELNLNDEYVARKKKIQEQNEHGTTNIERRIQEKREKKEKINAAGFKELTGDGIPEIFAHLFTNETELIKIFVQDEMIAEDYASYMTYFYPYSISNEELRYLNKVFSRINDMEQSEMMIQHPELVIEYLKPNDWDSVALPNKSLFKHMVLTQSEFLPKAILNLKKHTNDKFAILMIRELEREKNLSVWINQLIELWDDFIENLLNNSKWSQSEVFDNLLLILEHLDEKRIPKQFVCNYLHTMEEVLVKKCNSRIISILEDVGYKFTNISQLPVEMGKKIYLLDLYQINKQNIDFILQNYYDIKQEDIYTMNYTMIASNEEESLTSYVKDNLETYIREVYMPYCAGQSIETDAVVGFLNHPNVSMECKLCLCAEMSNILENIDEVNSLEVKQEILKNRKMEFNRINIISIWKDTEIISNELYEFLQYFYKNSTCQLSFSFAKKYFNETSEEHPKSIKLVNQLLDLEGMGKAYNNLVHDIGIQFTGLSTISWNEEQLEAIVGTRIILVTEKNLLLMRKLENKNIFYKWVSKQIYGYLKLMEKEELRKEEELQTLITLDNISDDMKIECINRCITKVHIRSSYNTHVVETIFENNLFDGDFIPIIRRYKSNRYGKRFMKSLGTYMIAHISELILMHGTLPYELLSYIMKHESVKITHKKRLLAVQTMYHSLEIIEECLELCGELLILDAFKGHKPRVPATEENRLLIEAMIKRKWLSSFKAIGEEYIIYPKKVSKQENVVTPV